MPRAAKICGHSSGCTRLVPAGTRYCAEHQRERTWQGADRKRTGTAAHKARRARVLARDGHRCQLRYEGVCIGVGSQLDHVIPLAEGGADIDQNTVAACPPCHRRKSSIEGHRARGHNV